MPQDLAGGVDVADAGDGVDGPERAQVSRAHQEEHLSGSGWVDPADAHRRL